MRSSVIRLLCEHLKQNVLKGVWSLMENCFLIDLRAAENCSIQDKVMLWFAGNSTQSCQCMCYILHRIVRTACHRSLLYLLKGWYLFIDFKTFHFWPKIRLVIVMVNVMWQLVSQHEQYQGPETAAAKLNPSIVTPVLLLLWHVKMSFVKKASEAGFKVQLEI